MKVSAVPLVRPVTVMRRGIDVTVCEVIELLPTRSGGAKLTVARCPPLPLPCDR